MDGILIVDKKEGMTSFDVVRDTRKKYNEKKVGHIGTLDPLASGVLPVLIGKATKLSDYLMNHDKEYVAKIKLGKSTETGDREGNVIETEDVPNNLNEENIQNVLNEFLGQTFQIPPMYSALKVNGKKLYEIARSGQNVERQPRKINISEIKIIKYDTSNKEIEYKVACSKGTYIRVLSEDIAKKLNTCGYMSYLRRTRVGDFKISDSGKFIPLEEIFKDNLNVIIDNQAKLDYFLNGGKINYKYKDSLCNIYYNQKFIGIGKIKNEQLRRFIII